MLVSCEGPRCVREKPRAAALRIGARACISCAARVRRQGTRLAGFLRACLGVGRPLHTGAPSTPSSIPNCTLPLAVSAAGTARATPGSAASSALSELAACLPTPPAPPQLVRPGRPAALLRRAQDAPRVVEGREEREGAVHAAGAQGGRPPRRRLAPPEQSTAVCPCAPPAVAAAAVNRQLPACRGWLACSRRGWLARSSRGGDAAAASAPSHNTRALHPARTAPPGGAVPGGAVQPGAVQGGPAGQGAWAGGRRLRAPPNASAGDPFPAWRACPPVARERPPAHRAVDWRACCRASRRATSTGRRRSSPRSSSRSTPSSSSPSSAPSTCAPPSRRGRGACCLPRLVGPQGPAGALRCRRAPPCAYPAGGGIEGSPAPV